MNVLVADKDERLRGAVADVLEHSNYTVVQCGNGAEVEEQLLGSVDDKFFKAMYEFDLLILSADMHRPDGVDLLLKMRNHQLLYIEGMPVILTSVEENYKDTGVSIDEIAKTHNAKYFNLFGCDVRDLRTIVKDYVREMSRCG